MTMNTTPLALETSGLTHRYRGSSQSALTDMGISIDQGSFAALIGPNGAGKSTLLRLASGILTIQKGSVRILGQDITSLNDKERARQVALVPQEPMPPFAWRGLDLVLLGRVPHQQSTGLDSQKDLEEATRALELVGALHLAERPLAELSGGERQRMVVARALAQRAPLVLLDEPTTHMDMHQRISLFAHLRDLTQDEGLTVVAVSHDLALAAQFCSPLVVMHEGRLHSAGTPSQVLSEQLLAEVFGVRALLHPHPQTGAPIPLPYDVAQDKS